MKMKTASLRQDTKWLANDSINRLACYNFFTLSLNPYVYDNVLVYLYFTKMQTHVF